MPENLRRNEWAATVLSPLTPKILLALHQDLGSASQSTDGPTGTGGDEAVPMTLPNGVRSRYRRLRTEEPP
jgi:hypothetical protein